MVTATGGGVNFDLTLVQALFGGRVVLLGGKLNAIDRDKPIPRGGWAFDLIPVRQTGLAMKRGLPQK